MFVAEERTGVGGAGRSNSGEGGGGAAAPGCAFIADDAAGRVGTACAAPRRPGSSYCETHHRLCHLAPGSRAEARQLIRIEALAEAAGGRLGRPDRLPSEAFLRRLERAVRVFSSRNRSRFVQDGGDRHG